MFGQDDNPRKKWLDINFHIFPRKNLQPLWSVSTKSSPTWWRWKRTRIGRNSWARRRISRSARRRRCTPRTGSPPWWAWSAGAMAAEGRTSRESMWTSGTTETGLSRPSGESHRLTGTRDIIDLINWSLSSYRKEMTHMLNLRDFKRREWYWIAIEQNSSRNYANLGYP